MRRPVYNVDNEWSTSLAEIASSLLNEEFGNDGQAAIALQEAGYTIRTDDPI